MKTSFDNLESTVGHEGSMNEREFSGFQITQIGPGSPAAVAGLCSGDVVTHLNGEPVSSSLASLPQITQRGVRMVFTVARQYQAEPLTLDVDPRLDAETGRYSCGIGYTAGSYVAKIDKEAYLYLAERMKGEYRNAKGEVVCAYSVDVRQEEVTCQLNSTVVTGRVIDAIRLSANGKSVELIERFNPSAIPIVLTHDEAVNGGKHVAVDSILVSEIERPDYIGVVLHELTHERQSREPKWKRYLAAYGLSNFRLDRKDILMLNPERRLRTLKTHVPALLEGVDEVMIQTGCLELNARISSARPVFEELFSLERILKNIRYLPVADRADQLIAYIKQLGEADPKWRDNPSNELEADTRRALEAKMRELGLETNLSNLWKTSFSALMKLASGSRGPEEQRQMKEEVFDVKSRRFTTTFQANKDSEQLVTWSLVVSEADAQSLGVRVADMMKRYQQLVESTNGIMQELDTVELRPGLGLLDVLSYPRWVAERDAERGNLSGLRQVREETGIDLLQAMSPFTGNELRLLTMVQDEELLNSQPPERVEEMKLQATMIRQQHQGNTIKVVQGVRRYMKDIGATQKAMRSMSQAGITRGF